MLTADNIESCVQRLKEEEGYEESCYGILIKTFLNLMSKLDIKIAFANAHGPGSADSNPYYVVISRKDLHSQFHIRK